MFSHFEVQCFYHSSSKMCFKNTIYRAWTFLTTEKPLFSGSKYFLKLRQKKWILACVCMILNVGLMEVILKIYNMERYIKYIRPKIQNRIFGTTNVYSQFWNSFFYMKAASDFCFYFNKRKILIFNNLLT